MFRYYVSFTHAPEPGAVAIAAVDVNTTKRVAEDADVTALLLKPITANGYNALFIVAFSPYAREDNNQRSQPRGTGQRGQTR